MILLQLPSKNEIYWEGGGYGTPNSQQEAHGPYRSPEHYATTFQ
jgi:hypothetical protein